MALFVFGKALPLQSRDHALKGSLKEYRECHIEPDWLLMYTYTDCSIIFVRTGTHSDLFE